MPQMTRTMAISCPATPSALVFPFVNSMNLSAVNLLHFRSRRAQIYLERNSVGSMIGSAAQAGISACLSDRDMARCERTLDEEPVKEVGGKELLLQFWDEVGREVGQGV